MNYIQEHTDKDYPRNIEAEQVVLGSALLEPNLTMPVIVDKKLLPEHFYERRHQYIFEAMLKLYVDAKPCDIVILANALEDAGTMEMSGGRMYLNQLLDRTTTTASLKHFVDIIRHKNTLRELIHAGERIEELGFDEIHEVNEVFSEANQIISSVSLPQDTPPYERIGGEMSEHLEKLERISADGGGVVGVPSGFSELDKLTSGFRDSDLVIIAARPGVGKCLGKGTPVLMFDGSIKNVEDVLDGDVLMGPDSLPRNVFGTTSGIGNLYRITPKKGGSYVVNENHVLSFKMSPSNTGDERYVCNVGVLDYFTKTKRWKHHAKGWRCGVDWPDKNVAIDPYILGLWLGDGSETKTDITTADNTIIEAIRNFANNNGLIMHAGSKQGKANTYAIVGHLGSGSWKGGNSFREGLRNYGIFSDKSIPREYLINSRKVRLELLAGLLDSDGELSHKCFVIAQKRTILAEQICFLARSVGLAAYIRKVTKKCYNSPTGAIGEYNLVSISGNTDMIPTKLGRKKASTRKINKDALMVGVEVSSVGVGEYFGFSVDKDNLFMLGDFTVTHNSSLATSIVRRAAMAGYKAGFFSLEMSKEQILNRLICAEGKINLQHLRTGRLGMDEWRKLTDVAGRISQANIFVNSSPENSLIDIVVKARMMKEREDIDILFIDYLQLITIPGYSRSRENEVAEISRTLKKLAMELDISVVALSQLNRNTESRSKDKRPTLADLRESGAIEQDADMVIFIYRDDYYSDANEMDEVIVPTELIVAKQRNGPIGRVYVSFHKVFVDFYPNVYLSPADEARFAFKPKMEYNNN